MRNWLTIYLVSMLLLGTVALGQTTQTLLMTGDPAADGNGTVQYFGYPTINNKGEVALVISHSDTQTPPLDTPAIYLVTTMSATALVRGGDPSPDGNGVFEYFGYDGNFLELVVVNDNGSVAFAAYLDQTNGGDDVDSSGIFGANATDGVTQYVRITDPAPDGNGVFGPPDSAPVARALSQPGLDNADRVSFHGILTDTSGGEFSDDKGIFRANDLGVIKLLRRGEPEPFGPDTVLEVLEQFGSNRAGQVAMEALIGTPKGGSGPSDGPGPSDDYERIYVANEVLLEQIFSSGGPPPDGDGEIGGFKRTRIADDGHVTFEAFVGGTLDPADAGPGLFFYDGLVLQEIVRRGVPGPGETDPFEFSSFPGLDSNIQDEVVFSAILERNAPVPDNRTTAIYRWTDGVLTVAVHQGDPAPDGNGTFGDLAHAVFLNNGGQIAFGALILGATPQDAEYGIFVVDSSGSIQRVARDGQPLAGSNIAGLGFLGGLDFVDEDVFGDSDLRLAGMNAINDSGEVPFWAGLGDGTQAGLFVWKSPEIISLDFEDGTFAGWDASP